MRINYFHCTYKVGTQLFGEFLGGLTFLLFGMRILTKGIQKATDNSGNSSGNYIMTMLKEMSRRKQSAFIVGIIVTAILQSSAVVRHQDRSIWSIIDLFLLVLNYYYFHHYFYLISWLSLLDDRYFEPPWMWFNWVIYLIWIRIVSLLGHRDAHWICIIRINNIFEFPCNITRSRYI